MKKLLALLLVGAMSLSMVACGGGEAKEEAAAPAATEEAAPEAEAEAPAEDIYGKILVANVVLNRVNSEKMANTVTGVIYEKIDGNTQFSPTAISWYWNSIVVTDSTREAVARCLSGEDYSDGALYFYAWERNPNKHKTSEWMRELECLFTHGGHRFFR